MKYIKVIIQAPALVNGKEYQVKAFPVEVPYSEAALVWAREHTCDGNVETYERQEQMPAPTRMDKLEAQAAYTAMMTDTLMEV